MLSLIITLVLRFLIVAAWQVTPSQQSGNKKGHHSMLLMALIIFAAVLFYSY